MIDIFVTYESKDTLTPSVDAYVLTRGFVHSFDEDETLADLIGWIYQRLTITRSSVRIKIKNISIAFDERGPA